ncbi:MAG: cyanophycin synthetase, partial [Bryocella sp.]
KRGNVVEYHGARLINDCYNSNPRALGSMVDALKKTAATRRIVVAGEMLELGPEAAALHRACGKAMVGVDLVVGVRGFAEEIVAGARDAGVAAEFVATPEAAGKWLAGNLREGDVVLLKGSRGVRLERALAALKCV